MHQRSVLCFELDQEQKQAFVRHGITEYSTLSPEELQRFLAEEKLSNIIIPTLPSFSRIESDIVFTCNNPSIDSQISPFLSGCITEICGLPGSGRTTLCLRYAKHCKTIWVDTEGCLVPSHPSDMFVIRIFDHIQFFALIHRLPQLVSEYCPQLIVIDSIAATLRGTSTDDGGQRTALLWEFLKMLRQIAAQTGCAVLLTNHMAKIQFHGFIPTLGPSWSFGPTHSIEIRKKSSSRLIRILKSPNIPLIEFDMSESPEIINQ